MTYDFEEIQRAARQVAKQIPGATPTQVIVAWLIEALQGTSPGERRWKPRLPATFAFGRPDPVLTSGEEIPGIDSAAEAGQ